MIAVGKLWKAIELLERYEQPVTPTTCEEILHTILELKTQCTDEEARRNRHSLALAQCAIECSREARLQIVSYTPNCQSTALRSLRRRQAVEDALRQLVQSALDLNTILAVLADQEDVCG